MKKILKLMCIVVGCVCLTGCSSKPQTGVSFEAEIVENMQNDEQGFTDMDPSELVSQQMQIAMENAEISDDVTGERAKKEFYEAMDTYGDVGYNSNGKTIGEIILGNFYRFYYTLRLYAAPICLGCILGGGFLFFFAKGNKGLRRTGLTLIFGVPLLMVILIIGIGYMNDLFLY